MHVRLVSTLTAEDEARLAPVLLQLVGLVLDQMPIVYSLRVETSDQEVLERFNRDVPIPSPDAVPSALR